MRLKPLLRWLAWMAAIALVIIQVMAMMGVDAILDVIEGENP